ncbi:MAG TPA: PilC/PilY family type IV pilus protein [Steroidobacteraceae bacterium]|nr:PilC/PilY family type IV pilus protein [Steroidobacteraceae bacterium]
MKNLKCTLSLIVALVALAVPFGAQAQTTGGSVADDFTGTSTSNPWYFFNGACLTAGTSTGVEPTTSSSGQVPGCTTIGTTYYNQPLVGGQNGVAGNTQTLPDPNGHGALRFTNGNPGGFSQNGGILSTTPFPTGSGVSITFKTVTYRGNSGGAGGDGADGISFFLMDSSALNTATITGTAAGDGNGLGSWGGSLGYTCSNANPPYNGLVGAYLGLGIDEYGNFLNGAQLMAGYMGGNSATGDNSHLGYGYKPNRIGLRGAGNIAWNWLHAQYPAYYPNSFTAAQQNAAVQQTCRNGVVWDYANGNKAVKVNGNTIPIYDYAPIPNAYVELPATTKIANEAAMARGGATTIFYQLKITQNGLMSLNYALCPAVGGCGAYQSVIQRQSITASNGPLPTSFLFGFAGSTGGANNIHEILCFKADPVTTAASGAGASEKQSAKLETGAQAYFAFYNPSNWTGRVTASTLGLDTFGNVVIAAAPNWDGACTLTGVKAGSSCLTTGVAGPLTAQAPTNRVILTSTGGTGSGIPFEWSSLNSAQQSAITAGDATPNANRVNYLRGDRTNEINTLGVGLFRSRSSVLADVIDSSPSWVGPPVSPYAVNWVDRLNMAAVMPEQSSSAQSYAQYVTAQQTRLNVVYVGANDGLLHGFRSGAYNSDGTFNTSSPNDGVEVLAYMPSALLQSIHSTTANLDYANAQYGHNFFEDATPGTGDVFYNNAWHSWLVGGLGAGGSAIFALDVTNPGPGVPSAGYSAFTEGQSSSLVIGEWNGSNITCVNVSNCGQNLGNTYGTPQLRRLHDGRWAVIFGNGFGSSTGDAGIFVMTLDPASAAPTFYYFSTGRGSSGNPNGIAFPSPADLDGDHITDYVYAGDLQGNVWRFDLTSANEASWGVSPGPLFYTGGQPIVTAMVVASGSPSPGMTPQIMVLFGTGQKNPLTNTQGATYATGTQSLYGVWDWNMAGWNSVSGATYASLANNNPAVPSGGSAGTNTLQAANLQQQTVTVNTTTGNRDITTNAAVCWAGNCASNGKFGWYLNFPGTQEQVIFSPELVSQALTVNSIVPAPNNPLSCATVNDTGFTYVLSAMTGGAFNQVFLPPSEAANPLVNSDARYTDNAAIAMQTNATGSSFITGNSAGTKYLVYETNQVQGGGGAGANNIQGGTLGLNLPPNTTGRRLSWIERR